MRHEPAPYLPHAGVPHIPTSVAPYVPDPPPGHNVVYRMYDPNTHKDIYLPAPRPGETYVVIPPKGRSIQVVDGTRSGSHSRSSSRSSARTPSSKKGQPLLRRLFNNFTPSIEWGPAPPDDRRPRTVSY
ncbi:hypothetical protein OBBRIDRAFT_794405 [Obba rivulosa]|uniref:Uncharacterized protein n=1 Tax=Obba rivulosa TaxID=1052685 RepID=A0A8E2AS06_9APHY|nr:hypothetical protein OBBRIDRAFT_794405 [Obba rivulosa]